MQFFGAKSKEERASELAEEQRVIEAQIRARQEEDRISCERRRNSSNVSNSSGQDGGTAGDNERGHELDMSDANNNSTYRNEELLRMEQEQRKYEEQQRKRQQQRWLQQQRLIEQQLHQQHRRRNHRDLDPELVDSTTAASQAMRESSHDNIERILDSQDISNDDIASINREDFSDEAVVANVNDFIPQHLLSESTTTAEMFGADPGMSVDLEDIMLLEAIWQSLHSNNSEHNTEAQANDQGNTENEQRAVNNREIGLNNSIIDNQHNSNEETDNNDNNDLEVYEDGSGGAEGCGITIDDDVIDDVFTSDEMPASIQNIESDIETMLREVRVGSRKYK